MKALVTGGGGFIGGYITEQLLRRGEEVTILARGSYPHLERMGVKVIRGNLKDFEKVESACKDMDTVFHTAAIAKMWGPWQDFFETNILGTRNIIKACRKAAVPKLVYTSSPSVVFSNIPQRGIDESAPYPDRFESHYAKSKAIAEKMVMNANGEDLLTVSLRPHLVFGPKDPHLLTTIVKRAKKRSIIQVGDGKNLVDFTYVEDAARAHLLAADALTPGSKLCGSAYFITQDQPVELWSWLNNLFLRLGLEKVKKRISLKTARTIALILEGIHLCLPFLGEPRLTRFLASELALDHFYNISKAKADFGYHPGISMEDALDNTIEYLFECLKD